MRNLFSNLFKHLTSVDPYFPDELNGWQSVSSPSVVSTDLDGGVLRTYTPGAGGVDSFTRLSPSYTLSGGDVPVPKRKCTGSPAVRGIKVVRAFGEGALPHSLLTLRWVQRPDPRSRDLKRFPVRRLVSRHVRTPGELSSQGLSRKSTENHRCLSRRRGLRILLP